MSSRAVEPEHLNQVNGSQTVHDQSRDGAANLLLSQSVELEHSNQVNGSQTVHDQSTDLDGAVNVLSSRVVEPEHLNQINGSQTVHDKAADLYVHGQSRNTVEVSFNKLVGIQRELILAIYKNIKMNGAKSTVELTLENIAQMSGVNIKSLKNTLFRLRAAGLLLCVDQKVGRGGWVKYSLNEELIKQMTETNFLIGNYRR